MSEIIRTYWLQILLTYFSVMGIILLWKWLRTRGKIQARIKNPDGREETRWVKPTFEGGKCYLVFEKETKKKAGWQAEYTNQSVIRLSGWLGLRHYEAIDILHGAPKAVEWDHKLKEAEQYRLTKQHVKEFSRWKALEARYSRLETPKTPLGIWIVAILVILVIILQLFGGRLTI